MKSPHTIQKHFVIFLCLDGTIHSKVGLRGWAEVGENSLHSFSQAPSGVILLFCFAFPLSRLLRNKRASQIFRLTFSYMETRQPCIRWQTVCVCVCLNNFAPFSKSQIIMSRVGGCFFFFFPNGCKSPAHVIKDADINILVCKLIPSAQLWGRGSVTEVRLRQCAVCAGSPERLICCCTLCKLWQLDCFHGWAEVAVFLLLRSIYWLPRKVQSRP